MQEVEGSSPTEQNSTSISVFTDVHTRSGMQTHIGGIRSSRVDTNFTIKCSYYIIHLQRDNLTEADIFVSESGHVSSFLLKKY